MELQTLVDKLDNACKKYGLQINPDKTKVMTTAEATCIIRCGNGVLEHMNSYAYLGSLMTMDGECDKEIRSRLAKRICNNLATEKNMGESWYKDGSRDKIIKSLVAMYR